MKYPDVTSNMVGPNAISSKSKGKQLVISSEESDVEPTSGLKNLLIEPEGIYSHTQTRTDTIAPINYSLLARITEINDEHSSILKSQS